jgi:hypothetical protein
MGGSLGCHPFTLRGASRRGSKAGLSCDFLKWANLATLKCVICAHFLVASIVLVATVQSVTPSEYHELRLFRGGVRLLDLRLHYAAAKAASPPAMLASRKFVLKLSCLLGIVLAAGASVAVAQGPVDGAIRGHITEVCGPYPHPCKAASVEIRVTSTDLATERLIEADSDGNFLMLRLQPGEYELRATSRLPDKATAVTMLDIEGGDLAEVMLTLGPPRVNPTAVYGTRLALTLASFGTPEQLTAIPVEANQWEDLVQLDSEANEAASTSVAGDTSDDDQDDPASRAASGDGASATGLSYAGLSAMQGSLSVDGLSGQQSFRLGPRGSATGGARSGSSYSQGSVRNFRMVPKNFSAQYGMVGGLAIVSRTASSRLHGNAFVLTRESSWAATNPFSIETHYRDGVVTSAPVKPAGWLMQFGGSVGLPLSKIKGGGSLRPHERTPLSLFASLEVQLHDEKIVSTPALANFFALSPQQMALLGTRGVSRGSTDAALNYLDSLMGTTTRHAYRVQGSLRFDAAPTLRDRITLMYTGNRFNSPSGAALGQASYAVVARGTGSLGDSVVHVDVGSVRWLHSFSSRLNNEVRAQAAHDLDYQSPHLPLPQEPAIGPGGYAPQVSIAPNGFSYGTPTSLARGSNGSNSAYPDELRVELADSLQWHVGRHLLMLGGDWSRIDDRIDSLSGREGAFNYDSGITNGKAGGLVDWITDYTFNVNAYPNGGCPSIAAAVHYFCFRSFTQSFGATSTEFVTHNIAGFVEDAIQVRSGLTVTLGLRYDYTLLPMPQASNPLLDADIAALNQPVHGSTGTFPEDRNNVGPRVALAWSPRTIWGLPARWSQKSGSMMTVHVGYGVFFSHIPGATVRAALTDTALPSTTTRVRIRPTTITLCPQVTAVQQGFGYPCDYITTPPAAISQTTSAIVFASNYRVPAVQRATIAVERALGARSNVRLSYSMALADQLPGTTDLNVSPSPGVVSYVLQGGDGHKGLTSGQAFVVPLYDQRPIFGYGAITALVSNANATYHAFTAETQIHGMRWNGLHSLELRGSYTFSRAIDYGPQSSATPGHDGQFDPFHNGYDKGLSNQQFPERFSGSLEYPIGVKRGAKAVRLVTEGWRVAAIAIAGSGRPYSYKVFGGPYLKAGTESINGSGGATYLPTIGRNTLHLPPQGKVDLRLSREFGVGSRYHLNAFAEAFNLTNALNISSVETRAFLVGTPAIVGQPVSSGLPTPLIFQDAAAITAEGLTTTVPFGTPSSSTTGVSRERQIELGLRLQF